MNNTVSVDENRLPHQLPQGTQLKGRYQLEWVLGQGGFGITYLGWDLWKRVRVAIKEYYPKAYVYRNCQESTELACITDAYGQAFHDGMDRFLREAEALRKLHGIPGIVSIWDFFQENNTAYIVMDYVEGINLKDYVERSGGKLTPQETFAILVPVMDALREVHNAKLVHRDIAPDNIMLNPEKGPVLLDFGAVRTVQNPQVDRDLSQSTEAIVKHGFAPIEQYHARGSLGPWTDIYALCATAWYCMTGLVPEPVPSRMAEGTDPDWDSIPGLERHQAAALRKGMSVRTSERFADVEGLSDALFSPEEDPKIPKWLIGSVILAAVVLAALIGMLIGTRKVDEKSTVTTVDTAEKIAAVTAPNPSAVPKTEETSEPGIEPSIPSVTESVDVWKNNILKLHPLKTMGINPETVISVTFLDSLDKAPAKPYELGADGRVVGWVEWVDSQTHVYFAAEGGINAQDCCMELFDGCTYLERINFGDAFHTDYAQNMNSMFAGCASLEYLDVGTFRTSNVTSMIAMFDGCGALDELCVQNFDTSRVTSMFKMFSRCTGLRELDLSNFDTSGVTDMGCMFSGCYNMEWVDVSSFDVRNVKSMGQMFAWCHELQELDFSGWDVSSVTGYVRFMEDGKTINGRPWQEFFQ